jgi:hypothetical protein
MNRKSVLSYNDIPYHLKGNVGLPYNYYDLNDDQRHLFEYIYDSFITKREIRDKLDRAIRVIDERFNDIDNEIEDMKKNCKLLED